LPGNSRPRVEVHIPGFSGNLYRRALELCLLERIRPERKFLSLELLKKQICRDLRRLGQKSSKEIK
jgi:riboflavin kinase/FMN adenylyltransferase